MRSTSARVTAALVAMLISLPAVGGAQDRSATWLDNSKPFNWNANAFVRTPLIAAKVPGAVDARCRDGARPAQLAEDKEVLERGWDLVGPYQGGWNVVIIRGTAGYDGMCRPLKYQDFVFVRGVFAGTLSPQLMDSRTDGALTRVSLESATRLTAEYARYAAADALCCPSRTTSVIFEVASERPAVRPVSASTSNNAATTQTSTSAAPPPFAFAGTSWQLVKFEGGDDTVLKPDDPSKYTIEFGADGALSARIDCNRGRGAWKSDGPSQITFGPLALTRAQCAPGSLHDQIVKQWGNIRSYVIRDGHLFLALKIDGGIYEFAPTGQGK